MVRLSTLFTDLLYSKKYWLVRHMLFWLIMYTDEVLAFSGLVSKSFDFKFFSFQIGVDLLLVYTNLYLLVPRFLNNRRLTSYFGYTLLTIVGALLVNYFIITHFVLNTTDIVIPLFRSFVLTMGVLGTAIAIKIIKQALTSQRRLRELEKLNYETEVNYLKMQLNPHFLFNTLNNLYIQSKKYPATVPESIMKLSDLMRYQLYKGSLKTVTLAEELKFVTDYLDLERLRSSERSIYNRIDVQDMDLKLSPMLLIPLVENAIKHCSPASNGNHEIDIYCTNHGTEIICEIKNTIGVKQGNTPGIGLANLQRRLDILYPNRHILSIHTTPQYYTASLRLIAHD